MKPMKPRRPSQTDASGPVVAWCAGHRCTGLHHLDTTDDRGERLRSTIRATPGAVLITSPCLGRCELGSLAAVGRRHGPTGQIGPMAWFAGVEDDSVFDALDAWIANGGPHQVQRPDLTVPSELNMAFCGIGPPPNVYQP